MQGCLAEGLQRTSAGLGSVIIDSQPLTVTLLAALLFGERIRPAGALGLLAGVAGLCLLELPPEALQGLVQQSTTGVPARALLGCACWNCCWSCRQKRFGGLVQEPTAGVPAGAAPKCAAGLAHRATSGVQACSVRGAALLGCACCNCHWGTGFHSR